MSWWKDLKEDKILLIMLSIFVIVSVQAGLFLLWYNGTLGEWWDSFHLPTWGLHWWNGLDAVSYIVRFIFWFFVVCLAVLAIGSLNIDGRGIQIGIFCLILLITCWPLIPAAAMVYWMFHLFPDE